MWLKYTTSLVLALFFSKAIYAESGLPPSIARVLKAQNLPQDSISVLVTERESNRVLLSHLSEIPRNPASVIKLLTTFASLDILGPGHLWRTGLYAESPLKQGLLRGNLYFKGGGDPLILTEDFLALVFALRQRGLTQIDGQLVIDNSLFTEASDAALDKQKNRVYNVPPDAAAVNFRATRFVFRPRQDRLEILADPPASNLKIKNRVTLGSGSCNGRHRQLLPAVHHNNGTTEVEFHGIYPERCGEKSITRSVMSHGDYIYGVFRYIWEQLGGKISPGWQYGVTPPGAVELVGRDSRPLFDTLRGINKYSNNPMARSLLMSLGVAVYGPPGTEESGLLAIREWLNKEGISTPSLNMDNGAGLSRNVRISARDLDQVLTRAEIHPNWPEFAASMSLTGVDGSTRKRLGEDDTQGRYRLKTGYLSGVRSVAGFGVTPKGMRVRLVILQNHPRVSYNSGNAVQDAVIEWIQAQN